MILIFGGTTEGRLAVDVCDQAGTPFYYSTKSDLQTVEMQNGIRLRGAMTAEDISTFCAEHEIKCIVDAAHPFAMNLHQAIQMQKIPVIRLQRQFEPHQEGVIYCQSYEDAIQKMESYDLKCLLALSGTNTISKLAPYWTQNRQGYVMWKQFGTLFVENRYTDWCNYFPHNTLKNLWMLSQFIPPRKFQFELLNNSRNDEKYGDDPLRPAAYDITYEFASVMVANPLVWMEMSNLTDKQITSLQKLVSVYRDVRKDFFNAEIYPIGEQPDGCSYTGFQIVVDDKTGYLLLFKEYGTIGKHMYCLHNPLPKKPRVTLLATNIAAKSALKLSIDEIPYVVVWANKRDRSFALYRYEG